MWLCVFALKVLFVSGPGYGGFTVFDSIGRRGMSWELPHTPVNGSLAGARMAFLFSNLWSDLEKTGEKRARAMCASINCDDESP